MAIAHESYLWHRAESHVGRQSRLHKGKAMEYLLTTLVGAAVASAIFVIIIALNKRMWVDEIRRLVRADLRDLADSYEKRGTRNVSFVQASVERATKIRDLAQRYGAYDAMRDVEKYLVELEHDIRAARRREIMGQLEKESLYIAAYATSSHYDCNVADNANARVRALYGELHEIDGKEKAAAAVAPRQDWQQTSASS